MEEKYVKPDIEIIDIEEDILLTSGAGQCCSGVGYVDAG